MAAQSPSLEPSGLDRIRRRLGHLWREHLNPSRSGTGRETRTGQLIHLALFVAATLSALVTIGIIAVLIFETVEFFRTIPLGDFFGDTVWSPLINVFNPNTGELEPRFVEDQDRQVHNEHQEHVAEVSAEIHRQLQGVDFHQL